MPGIPETRSILVPLSETERQSAPRLTGEEIDRALEEGYALRTAAERSSQSSPLDSTGALRYKLDLPVTVMPTCCARQTTASFTAWRASPRLAPMPMYATVFTFPPNLPD